MSAYESPRFRTDVEGLRAVAVVPVVAFHVSGNLVPGGYVGVDIFFVISGFLISQIILREIANNSFSFISFYRRRIRRIFPALFFMLAGTSAAALFVLPPSALAEYGRTLLATTFFVSNMEFMRLSGYFDGSVEFKPLLHTWSLAVEEQFYIVFPILLIVTRRYLKARYLAVFVICAVLTLILSEVLTRRYPEQAFYFGPTRAYELLIGAVLALDALPRLTSRTSREIMAGAGLALIAGSMFGFDHNTGFPGIAALVPCLGAAMIIYAGQNGNSAVAGVLSIRPVRFVGAISYSLYLWHWPVLALMRNYYLGVLNPALLVMAVVVTFALAVFSRRVVEAPFLERQGGVSLFVSAGLAMATSVAVSVGMFLTSGLPGRYPAESLKLIAHRDDYNHRRPECHVGQHKLIPYASSCIYGDQNAVPTVAVWGDSHGAELARALGETVGRDASVMQITASACPPALDFRTKLRPLCDAHNRDAFAGLTRDDRIRTVVLIARYEQYRDDWGKFRAGFEHAISGLVGAGKKVIVVDPFPGFAYPVPDALGILLARGLPPDGYRISWTDYESRNARALAELGAVAAKNGVSRVGVGNVLCDTEYCRATAGKTVLYFDDNHLSNDGAALLAKAIAPLLPDGSRIGQAKASKE